MVLPVCSPKSTRYGPAVEKEAVEAVAGKEEEEGEEDTDDTDDAEMEDATPPPAQDPAPDDNAACATVGPAPLPAPRPSLKDASMARSDIRWERWQG